MSVFLLKFLDPKTFKQSYIGVFHDILDADLLRADLLDEYGDVLTTIEEMSIREACHTIKELNK
jgi:hypothetical protein